MYRLIANYFHLQFGGSTAQMRLILPGSLELIAPRPQKNQTGVRLGLYVDS